MKRAEPISFYIGVKILDDSDKYWKPMKLLLSFLIYMITFYLILKIQKTCRKSLSRRTPTFLDFDNLMYHYFN